MEFPPLKGFVGRLYGWGKLWSILLWDVVLKVIIKHWKEHLCNILKPQTTLFKDNGANNRCVVEPMQNTFKEGYEVSSVQRLKDMEGTRGIVHCSLWGNCFSPSCVLFDGCTTNLAPMIVNAYWSIESGNSLC